MPFWMHENDSMVLSAKLISVLMLEVSQDMYSKHWNITNGRVYTDI